MSEMNEEPEIRRPLRGRPPGVKPLANEEPLASEEAVGSAEDPRARAARVAAKVREARAEFGDDDAVDEFKAPPAPDGWEYQWKRKSVFGKEDFAHQNNLHSKGWSEVPLSRHPEFMPLGSSSKSIEHKEMVLMECPAELVADARDKEKRAARALVSQKAAQLDGSGNNMLNNQTDKTPKTLKRSYSPIAIPE